MTQGAEKRLAFMIAQKAAAELASALPDGWIDVCGPVPADVLAVKGRADLEDVAAGRALGGPDEEALRKALDALGWEVPFLALCVERGGERLPSGSLRLVIEAVDPDLVVALDEVAAMHVAEAEGIERLPFGEAITVAGRMLGAVDGLYESLSDVVRKRRVWDQFKAFKRET